MDFEANTASALLTWAATRFEGRFAVVTSFQAEGLVLLDLASRLKLPVRVVTLDTGRLPAETHQMMETIRSRYGFHVESVTPDAGEVSAMTAQFGPNPFYRERALRELCCEIRKVRPLDKKLLELSAYAAGLRRDQSDLRRGTKKAEQVEGCWKLCPLADWTRDSVWEYIREHDVPVHPLYAEGYRTIGCAPCTRAVQSGESERAGRWWWEDDAVKECGLHFSRTGQAQRPVDVMLAEVLSGAVRI